MKISIIIPMLNEGANIAATLAHAGALAGDFEIIAVDGGSSDATLPLLHQRRGVRVLQAPCGRATQMNHGAAIARGNVLLFLHADTRLPGNAHSLITAALADSEIAGGCFRLSFDQPDAILRFSAFCTRFSFPYFHFGDSAYFVRREHFRALGGYRQMPILEDLDFWLRLCRRHRLVILPGTVVTSARRFVEHGTLRQQMVGIWLVLLFYFGVDAASLKQFYARHHKSPKQTMTAKTVLIATSQPVQMNGLPCCPVFKKLSLWHRFVYPARTLWHWAYSNLHLAKETYHVVDFMLWHKVGARALPDEHPWLTGRLPGSQETVWEHNIVFASPHRQVRASAPEPDHVIVRRIGQFLAAMVRCSNQPQPALPQGKTRRMPHAVNYIHGAIHYNGGFLIFDDMQDAMYHFSDRRFVREFKRFARTEKRELTVVLRERDYDPEEYAWFVAFIRAHQPWFANGNGPTKKRVLYGTPSPYPAVNPINGSWVRDMWHLYRGEIARIVRPPIPSGAYFTTDYQGDQADFTFMERFHAWAQHLLIQAKGFQGGLVFTRRRKIEPENWQKYQATQGQWRASYAVSHPFARIAAVRARRQRLDKIAGGDF